ncbi:hypothetical protein CBM2589_A20041 [Cupriavidus taiwanensis]|uniref:Uncharacterized protein n=1 Tax=Cupriavidus taiwanensis TaxID=164546 RepID=A0A375BZY9_9BURK|nr:hypothetical protein CBM2589_A20041 [Cupriavidus taiwanensis]
MPAKRFTGGAKKHPAPHSAMRFAAWLSWCASPAVLMLSTPPGHDLPPAFKPNRFTNGFHSPDKSL